MSIEDFQNRLKRAGILYVDVYVYHYDPPEPMQVLLLKRTEKGELAGSFQPVSGKIEEGESICHAFQRQVELKVGAKPVDLHKLDVVNTFYDEHYDTVMFVPCAAARIELMQVQINPKYHTEARWVTVAEATALLDWSVQRRCVEDLERQVTGPQGIGRFHRLTLNP